VKQKLAGGRTVQQVLALLMDAEFCADAQRTITQAAEITIQPTTIEERQAQLETLGQRFEDRWGVPPPTTGELLDSDPRRPLTDAVASGHWGLVLLSPSTTNRQIRAAIKQIRSVVGKQHGDALIARHAQLVRWLQVIGFDDPTIARAVFRMRKGLHRPTKAEAIARTPEDRENELYEQYQRLGLTAKQVERKVYRRLQGSEAPASAAIRMTQSRYVKRLERLNEDLATPTQSEPLSKALTALFRALPDESNASVRQHVVVIRDAFYSIARASEASAGRSVGRPQPPELMDAGCWGVVPVFPWTTDPDVRASIKKLRATIGPQPDPRSPEPSIRPCESLGDALVSLFRALNDQDDVVRRHAYEVRAAFMQVKVP
jgi:hypothetical protein